MSSKLLSFDPLPKFRDESHNYTADHLGDRFANLPSYEAFIQQTDRLAALSSALVKRIVHHKKLCYYGVKVHVLRLNRHSALPLADFVGLTSAKKKKSKVSGSFTVTFFHRREQDSSAA